MLGKEGASKIPRMERSGRNGGNVVTLLKKGQKAGLMGRVIRKCALYHLSLSIFSLVLSLTSH